MQKRLLGLLAMLAMLLAAWPAYAGKNAKQTIMAATEVAVSVPVSVTINNPFATAGYLNVTTTNETATASLVVTISNVVAGSDVLVCTMTAITTDTTTIALLGSTLTAGDGITDACDWPMSRRVKFTFTTSGAGADFDVAADMEWLAN